MANQLKMAFIDAILTLYSQGWSQRAIARRLGVHRGTVSRHVRLAASISKPATLHAGTGLDGDAPPTADIDFSTSSNIHVEDLPPPASASALPARGSYCDRFRDTIEAKRATGLTAQRIYQDLVTEHSFAKSYSTVQRYVRRLEQVQPLPFRRMECCPGEEAQIDFGVGAPIITEDGKRRKTHVFRIVLSHSRKAYSEAVDRQTTDNFIRCVETGTPPDPDMAGPCFNFLEACYMQCPPNNKLPGGCTLEYFVVQSYAFLLEPVGIGYWTKPARPTYYNIFGTPRRGYLQHGVGRLCCPQEDGTMKCMYFDVGYATQEGQFGGRDRWFSPSDDDFLFDIDPDLTFLYRR
jgi:hypothetical protein